MLFYSDNKDTSPYRTLCFSKSALNSPRYMYRSVKNKVIKFYYSSNWTVSTGLFHKHTAIISKFRRIRFLIFFSFASERFLRAFYTTTGRKPSIHPLLFSRKDIYKRETWVFSTSLLSLYTLLIIWRKRSVRLNPKKSFFWWNWDCPLDR